MPAVTADQMRHVDRIAIDETGPNLFQMMENAGRSLALLAIDTLGRRWRKARILVLAGGGGNGGGGICAARHLANRSAHVTLCLADARHLDETTALQLKIFRSAAGAEIAVQELAGDRPDLIVDALIGYGLRSAPRDRAGALIRYANATHAPVLSLDVPSGVDATSGDAPGDFVRARWTMTLALPKTGLLRASHGILFLSDLGIPRDIYARLGLDYRSPFGERFYVRLRRPRGRWRSSTLP